MERFSDQIENERILLTLKEVGSDTTTVWTELWNGPGFWDQRLSWSEIAVRAEAHDAQGGAHRALAGREHYADDEQPANAPKPGP
jgi:hypothetical protein